MMRAPFSAPSWTQRLGRGDDEPGWFAGVAAVDLLALACLWVAGAWYLGPLERWGAWWVFVGGIPTGDAQFWWTGVLDAHAGNIAENINMTFRMGFALIGAIFCSLFGTSLPLFHAYLVALYLLGCSVLYLALLASAGRAVALFASFALVLNPFQAEWLANFTSDGLGMIFNLFAAAFFIIALRGKGHAGAVGTAMFALALGGLTRPLMNLFAVPALGLIFLKPWPWRRRLMLAGIAMAANLVPALIWTGILYANTGVRSIAGHDGSIFYAASNPNVQQWSPTMYPEVQERAKARYGTDAPTQVQLNDQFRREAIRLYFAHPGYHVRRAFATVWATAEGICEATTRHVSNPPKNQGFWHAASLAGLALAGAGLAAVRRDGRAAGAGVLLAVGLAVSTGVQAAVLIAFTLAFCALAFRRSVDAVYAIAGFLMATAFAAMYVVGGVWNLPNGQWHLNALGSRLSSQFVFVAALIWPLGLLNLAAWLPRSRPSRIFHFPFSILHFSWAARPDPRLSRACGWGVAGALALWLALMAAGSAVLAQAVVARSGAKIVRFPDLQPLVAALEPELAARGQAGSIEASQAFPGFVDDDKNLMAPGRFLLTTGACSPFIWNVPGQGRTLLWIYMQDRLKPFMHHRPVVRLEAPGPWDPTVWAERQGAWLFRRRAASPPPSHLYFYTTYPDLVAFVPIAADGKSYDLAQAVWFAQPVTHAHLAGAGRLAFSAGRTKEIGWPDRPGRQKTYPRGFDIWPQDATAALEIDVAGLGPQPWELRFAYAVRGRAPLAQSQPRVQVRAQGSPDWRPAAGAEISASAVRVPGLGPDIERLRIEFNGLPESNHVRLEELILTPEPP